MSTVIADCKGFVHVFENAKGSGGTGFYKVKPPIPDAGDGRCLIQGIPIAYQEIVQPTVTLDDRRTLYVFGSAWNEIMLNGVLLLGPDKGNGDMLGSLLSWYDAHRVSKFKAPVELSVGPKSVMAYVTGLRLDAADPNFNRQAFTIIMLTAET